MADIGQLRDVADKTKRDVAFYEDEVGPGVAKLLEQEPRFPGETDQTWNMFAPSFNEGKKAIAGLLTSFIQYMGELPKMYEKSADTLERPELMGGKLATQLQANMGGGAGGGQAQSRPHEDEGYFSDDEGGGAGGGQAQPAPHEDEGYFSDDEGGAGSGLHRKSGESVRNPDSVVTGQPASPAPAVAGVEKPVWNPDSVNTERLVTRERVQPASPAPAVAGVERPVWNPDFVTRERVQPANPAPAVADVEKPVWNPGFVTRERLQPANPAPVVVESVDPRDVVVKSVDPRDAVGVADPAKESGFGVIGMSVERNGQRIDVGLADKLQGPSLEGVSTGPSDPPGAAAPGVPGAPGAPREVQAPVPPAGGPLPPGAGARQPGTAPVPPR